MNKNWFLILIAASLLAGLFGLGGDVWADENQPETPTFTPAPTLTLEPTIESTVAAIETATDTPIPVTDAPSPVPSETPSPTLAEVTTTLEVTATETSTETATATSTVAPSSTWTATVAPTDSIPDPTSTSEPYACSRDKIWATLGGAEDGMLDFTFEVRSPYNCRATVTAASYKKLSDGMWPQIRTGMSTGDIAPGQSFVTAVSIVCRWQGDAIFGADAPEMLLDYYFGPAKTLINSASGERECPTETATLTATATETNTPTATATFTSTATTVWIPSATLTNTPVPTVVHVDPSPTISVPPTESRPPETQVPPTLKPSNTPTNTPTATNTPAPVPAITTTVQTPVSQTVVTQAAAPRTYPRKVAGKVQKIEMLIPLTGSSNSSLAGGADGVLYIRFKQAYGLPDLIFAPEYVWGNSEDQIIIPPIGVAELRKFEGKILINVHYVDAPNLYRIHIGSTVEFASNEFVVAGEKISIDGSKITASELSADYDGYLVTCQSAEGGSLYLIPLKKVTK
ncbi:MAG: hypothetical protein AAB443_02425 [Patescibacteria group bacterium]